MLTAISVPRVLPDVDVRDVDEVYLQFAVGSRAMGLAPLDPRVRPLAERPDLPTVFRTSRGALDDSTESPLLFHSEGEGGELASVVVGIGEGRTAILWGDSLPMAAGAPGPNDEVAVGDFCGGSVAMSQVRGRPQDFLYGPDQYKAQMDRRLAIAGPGQRERRFFYGIDRATHPRLAGDRFVRPEVRHIVQTSLEHRSRDYRASGERSAVPPPTVKYNSEKVRGFFDQALDVIERLLADLAPGEIDDAFDHFANGALRMRLPNGEWTTQPSSGFFFLFGELGLVGVELRGASTWMPFARAAIRAQEIFARVYKASDRNPNAYNHYSGCAFSESRCFDRAAQARLRAEYDGLFFDDLQRRSCANALKWLPGFC